MRLPSEFKITISLGIFKANVFSEFVSFYNANLMVWGNNAVGIKTGFEVDAYRYRSVSICIARWGNFSGVFNAVSVDLVT